MKKHLLIAVLFIAATQVSQAQTSIKAGTVQLGGSIGYSHQSVDHTFSDGLGAINLTSQHAVSNYFTINPSAGYFLADNLAVGISAGYTTNKVVFTYGNGSSNIKGTSKAGNMYWGLFYNTTGCLLTSSGYPAHSVRDTTTLLSGMPLTVSTPMAGRIMVL